MGSVHESPSLQGNAQIDFKATGRRRAQTCVSRKDCSGGVGWVKGIKETTRRDERFPQPESRLRAGLSYQLAGEGRTPLQVLREASGRVGDSHQMTAGKTASGRTQEN